jgi:hypothetical protein
MYQNKVSSVLHLDSDVLLYSPIEEISNCYGHLNWECGLSIPKQDSNSFTWSASGHISYWTITTLEDFCNLTIASFSEREYLERYQKKWDWHLSQNKSGGICDMTTLYLFWEANQNRIINMAKSEQSNVFDLNMNIASNYENPQYVTESGIKKVHFVNGHPFLVPINQTEALDRAHDTFRGERRDIFGIFIQAHLFQAKPMQILSFSSNLSRLNCHDNHLSIFFLTALGITMFCQKV